LKNLIFFSDPQQHYSKILGGSTSALIHLYIKLLYDCVLQS
jgi:hypothetical protein